MKFTKILSLIAIAAAFAVSTVSTPAFAKEATVKVAKAKKEDTKE